MVLMLFNEEGSESNPIAARNIHADFIEIESVVRIRHKYLHYYKLQSNER